MYVHIIKIKLNSRGTQSPSFTRLKQTPSQQCGESNCLLQMGNEDSGLTYATLTPRTLQYRACSVYTTFIDEGSSAKAFVVYSEDYCNLLYHRPGRLAFPIVPHVSSPLTFGSALAFCNSIAPPRWSFM